MIQKDLTTFLQEKQTPGDWVKISRYYEVLGNPKQASDYVRKLWKKLHKSDFMKDRANDLLEDWDEFVEFKKQKLGSEKKDGIHIILGCVHVPFHNKNLLNKLLQFITDQKQNIIGFHLVGDFLDLKSLSSHDEKIIQLSGLTLGKEYNAGNEILDLIESALPLNVQKTFLYGNHEDRYFRWIHNIKNYKTSDAIQSPEQALRLEERGYKVFSNWKEDYFQIGKYQVFHGVYCTVNPSKSHVDKLRESCIFAHTHRINQFYDGWLHGLNIGCLADLDSDCFSYLSRVEKTNWKNGFGIVNISGDISQAEVIVCENDGFFYNGKRY